MLIRCEEDPASSPNPNIRLKKHEVVWFKGLQGWVTSYLVQRAWHGDTIAPGTVLESPATASEWQNWISSISITSGGKPAKPN